MRSPVGSVGFATPNLGSSPRARHPQRSRTAQFPAPSRESAENRLFRTHRNLLQKNVLNTRRWDTREALRLAMVTWIETKYNRRRRQRALGKLTPVEFDMIYTTAEAA